MPNINVTTGYSGEVLDNILTKVALGNEIVEKGIMHVQQGVTKKFHIPRMGVSGKFLQKRKARIATDGTDSKGDVNYDERTLEPQDMMVYTEFNPATFEHVWRQYQPTGNMVFEQLPPSVQNKMLELILKKTANEMGDYYINGIKGPGDYEFFNGLVARIMSDADTTHVTSKATTWVNRFADVYKAIPEEMVDDPNLVFVMNTADYIDYDLELKAQYGKNIDPTGAREQAYNGVRIVRLAKWPKGLLMATLGSFDEDSNLWACVHLSSDENAVLIDRVNNASEFQFVKLLLTADVNTAFGEFCVMLDNRTADAAYITDYSGTATSIPTSSAKLGATYRYTNSGASDVTIASGLAEGVDGVVKGKATRVFHFNGTAWF